MPNNKPTNPLLIKGETGKPKPSVYDLPPPEHAYGQKFERDPTECAETVLRHWQASQTSKNRTPALDYIAMNRTTAKQGISPKEIRTFRKEHPVRIKVGHQKSLVNISTATQHRSRALETSGGNNGASGAAAGGDTSTKKVFRMSNSDGIPPRIKRHTNTIGESFHEEMLKLAKSAPLPSDVDPGYTYGKTTRPSTPVAILLTDKYQREWINEQEKKRAEEAEKELQKMKKKIHKTVTPRQVSKKEPTAGPAATVKKDPKTLFKISKFTKAGPRISSWRDDETGDHKPTVAKQPQQTQAKLEKKGVEATVTTDQESQKNQEKQTKDRALPKEAMANKETSTKKVTIVAPTEKPTGLIAEKKAPGGKVAASAAE
ncbi:hypothetical protein HK102_002418 [Quaeritorhiza haematococci]|nr:hypothetical protein HK102_002418 [Quaeritorhiza haematococci]